MQKDFVAELGYLSLAVRLKRISDAMIHSGRQMYKSLGLDIEPNWFLIFKILDQHERLSITEIADHLGFAHPSVITMVRKMKARQYLEYAVDASDSRKKLVRLSDHARQVLPAFETIWLAGARSIQELFEADDPFLDTLSSIENQYRESDFMTRTLNELHYA